MATKKPNYTAEILKLYHIQKSSFNLRISAIFSIYRSLFSK